MKNLIRNTIVLVLLATAFACQPSKSTDETTEVSDSTATYACSMHPEITSSKPGKCQKCGMELTKLESKEETPHIHSDTTKHE